MRRLLLAVACVALCPALFSAQDKIPPSVSGPPAPPPIDSICDANQADLVANCGFETGDFSTLSVSGPTDWVSVDPIAANSGAYGAEFGTIGTITTVYPGFASAPGSTYFLEFWLANELGGSGTSMTAIWSSDGFFDDAFVLLDLENSDPFDWTLYTFGGLPVTSDNGGALAFSFQHDPAFWYLDDVDLEMETSSSSDGSPVAAHQPTRGIPRVVARGPFAPGAAGHLARRPTQVNGFARFGFHSPAEAFRSFVQKVTHPIPLHARRRVK
jgi:hypothetical protein